MKKALVVVSFGSSVPSARECLKKVDETIHKCEPDRDLFSCFTSNFIRKKLISQGENMPSLEEILENLANDGYSDVKVVSTHIIPGQEYEKFCGMVDNHAEKFETVCITNPLIHDAESIQRVAKVVAEAYPVPEDQAVIFMGHGTEHLSNFIYPALQTAFRTNGNENMFVATVEGWPELSHVMNQLYKAGIKNVLLAPFLLVAGDHVMNDMMGPEEDSWKNVLEAHGFKVECCGKGLSEYPEIVAQYVHKN